MLCKLGPKWAYFPLLQEVFDRGMERTLDSDTGSRCRWYGMDPAQELLTPCGPSQHCYLKCKSSCLPCWVPRWFRECVELLCKLWNALLCSVAVASSGLQRAVKLLTSTIWHWLGGGSDVVVLRRVNFWDCTCWEHNPETPVDLPLSPGEHMCLAHCPHGH